MEFDHDGSDGGIQVSSFTFRHESCQSSIRALILVFTVQMGQKHGQGEMLFYDGSFYVGEWDCDKYQGTGRFVFANGDTYEGEWKGGVPHGEGRQYLTETQETYEGKFESGDRQVCALPFHLFCFLALPYVVSQR